MFCCWCYYSNHFYPQKIQDFIPNPPILYSFLLVFALFIEIWYCLFLVLYYKATILIFNRTTWRGLKKNRRIERPFHVIWKYLKLRPWPLPGSRSHWVEIWFVWWFDELICIWWTFILSLIALTTKVTYLIRWMFDDTVVTFGLDVWMHSIFMICFENNLIINC